ncbi:hypothetical protein JNB91_29670 [Rhizobium wenxiniae]|jgi:hypothetical protein|uniref:hypothetical protein n=1 Tax=Rhizobium wenxiniae TaxID=1737357 RepID=UPI001C6E5688|nr:hypothetical protein [Rhizobium wenxiniae]MBW9091943.1 hypothetical protein [Rhizobium wenxiniae]
MSNGEDSKNIESDLREIRDLLYRAVQDHMAQMSADAKEPTKQAYERLSSLLDSLGSNLKLPLDDRSRQPGGRHE